MLVDRPYTRRDHYNIRRVEHRDNRLVVLLWFGSNRAEAGGGWEGGGGGTPLVLRLVTNFFFFSVLAVCAFRLVHYSCLFDLLILLGVEGGGKRSVLAYGSRWMLLFFCRCDTGCSLRAPFFCFPNYSYRRV